MVFIGEPNMTIRISNQYVIRATNQKGFKFDDKGEYSTDNPLLIKYLSQHFKVKEEIKHDAIEEKPQRKGRKQ